MKIIKFVPFLAAVWLISACAEPTLDGARFAMDKCSTTNLTPCTTAANEAQTILDSEPNNADAALIKSAALATRGGIDILDILAELAKTGVSGGVDNDTQKFKIIHNAVVGSVQNITDLRTAIAALTSFDASTLDTASEIYKDFYFQMGMLQTIEAFSLPTITAQPTAADAVDPTPIDATEKDPVLDDFLNADNNLGIAGLDSADDTGFQLVTAIRQNYCILNNISGGGGGFTTEELQDLMSCQLCIDETDTSICPKSVDEMLGANGDFRSTIASCADFNFTTCDGAGNTAP
ncbi:MAG: hypothetical protein HYU98_06605 [Deltaproteobacteria bacterium]|nr:hypothetical protein [Deltaproteobacteria bacterium]